MGSVADLWTLLIRAEQSLEVSWKGPASVAPQAPSGSDIKRLRAGEARSHRGRLGARGLASEGQVGFGGLGHV